MMMNLFSIFDPATSTSLSFNWISSMLFIMIMPMPYWLNPSRYKMMFKMIKMSIFNEFKSIIPYSYSNIMIFISIFMFISINNFMGLFPYIFTASSHMTFGLSFSLTMWLSVMIYSLTNFFNDTMAHLTPSGTPPIFMPFMVMIETISMIIRPLTLAIRLTANMIAGHLLLTLLSNAGELSPSNLTLTLIILSQVMLFTLEISASLIQAYVFSVLMVLYSSEC